MTRLSVKLCLLLFPALCFGQWSGFPLAENADASSWYYAHEIDAMQQIVSAYNERLTAVLISTNMPEYEYVESVVMDGPNEAGWHDGVTAWTDGGWFGYEQPNEDGQYYTLNDGWVTANEVLEYEPYFGDYLIIYGGFPVVTQMTHTVSITNTFTNFTFGVFTREIDGVSYTGSVQVTKSLMDMLWGGIGNMIGQYVTRDSLDETYYAALAVPSYFASGQVSGWHLDPPGPPVLSLAYAWDKYELGRLENVQTNRAGIITGGTVDVYEPPAGLAFDVNLAESVFDGSNWVYRSRQTEAGIDTASFLRSASTNLPLVYNTNLTGSVTVYGSVLTGSESTQEVVYIDWNTNFAAAELYGRVTNETVTANSSVSTMGATEEIAIGARSTNIWTQITNMTVDAVGATGDYVVLVWEDVEYWQDGYRRLYAQYLDRLYYVLNEMTLTHRPEKTSYPVKYGWYPKSTTSFAYSYNIDDVNSGLTNSPLPHEYSHGQDEDSAPPWWYAENRETEAWWPTNIPPGIGEYNPAPSFGAVASHVHAGLQTLFSSNFYDSVPPDDPVWGDSSYFRGRHPRMIWQRDVGKFDGGWEFTQHYDGQNSQTATFDYDYTHYAEYVVKSSTYYVLTNIPSSAASFKGYIFAGQIEPNLQAYLDPSDSGYSHNVTYNDSFYRYDSGDMFPIDSGARYGANESATSGPGWLQTTNEQIRSFAFDQEILSTPNKMELVWNSADYSTSITLGPVGDWSDISANRPTEPSSENFWGSAPGEQYFGEYRSYRITDVLIFLDWGFDYRFRIRP